MDRKCRHLLCFLRLSILTRNPILSLRQRVNTRKFGFTLYPANSNLKSRTSRISKIQSCISSFAKTTHYSWIFAKKALLETCITPICKRVSVLKNIVRVFKMEIETGAIIVISKYRVYLGLLSAISPPSIGCFPLLTSISHNSQPLSRPSEMCFALDLRDFFRVYSEPLFVFARRRRRGRTHIHRKSH